MSGGFASEEDLGILPPAPTEEGVQLSNEAAERSVIGAILLEPERLWEVLERLSPAMFSDPALATVWQAMADLGQKGEPVDAISIGEHLRKTGRIDARVTLALPHVLMGEAQTAANVGYHAGIIDDLAKRRRIIAAASHLEGLAKGSEDNPEALIESARAILDEAAASMAVGSQRIGEGLEALIEALDLKPGEAPDFQRTPWAELDQVIGGWRPGGLYVIAARPGRGKSALALQIARGLAQSGGVGFISLEMGQEELLKRLVASDGRVRMDPLVDQRLTKNDWLGFAHAAPAIRDLDLYVRTDIDSPLQMISWARSMHRLGMRALVVDYLQLLRSDERQESREAALATITRSLKRLAQQLGIPVILLSQLNREGSQRKGKAARPQITDLRGSGAIEQDADVVLLLHREEDETDLEIHVAKNRHGREGSFELQWQGSHTRAISKEWSPTALLNEQEARHGE